METKDFIKISRKPKRNYAELLADSSDFGSWDGLADVSTYEEKKCKKKKSKKERIKKLAREIAAYDF